MFVKMRVVWQESQQCLPCRLDKTGFSQERGGPMPCPMQADEGPLLPSWVVNHTRDISAPAHQSHRAAAHPPHLVTSTTDSPPLVAFSFCSHAK